MPIPRELRHHYRGKQWAATRERILTRAGHRCETCGVRNYARGWRDRDGTFHYAAGPHWKKRAGRHKLITVRLTVAHLNHVAGDDRDENLRALCCRCHFLYDAHHHKQTRGARKDRERPLLALLAS